MAFGWQKAVGYTAAGIIGIGLAALAYLSFRKPETAPPRPVRAAMTPERIARGKYIYTLADCDGCHSERDFTRFAGPVVESGRGRGSIFPREMGLPGTVVAPNITPDRETGLGNWTDGEKIRAIRDGVSRDGRALFALMPYKLYRQMSDEDVESLVAYLNTLRPIRNSLPLTKLTFPVGLLIKREPKPAGSVPPPNRGDRVGYGGYLAALGGCVHCHSTSEDQPFAGGMKFSFPAGTVISANITPDRRTGIGTWSEEFFVERFNQYKQYAEQGAPHVGPEGFTLMPWLSLATLESEDLKAIYAYLKTRRPIEKQVIRRPVVLNAGL